MAEVIIDIPMELTIEDATIELDELSIGEDDVDIENLRMEAEIVINLDYNSLKNKPSINNTELIGNYDEIDPTVPAWAKEPTKPKYEADEIDAVDKENRVTESELDLLFLQIFGV